MSCPRNCQSSSPRCGANGERQRTKSSSIAFGSDPPFASSSASFTKTIIAEMAVLNAIASTSSPTFFTIFASDFASSFVMARSAICVSVTSLFARFRKRWTPSTPLVDHGLTACSGPMNIS